MPADYVDDDGLCVPALVAGAPGPIRWFLKLTYCPLLSGDDTPRERLLKSFVFVTVPFQGAPLSNMALSIGTGVTSEQGMTAGNYVECGAMIMLNVLWGALYLRVRATQQVTEWTADAVSFVTWLAVMGMAISDTDSDICLAALAAAFFMLIALTPRTPILCVLYAVAYFLSSYNFAVADENRNAPADSPRTSLPLLAVPGALDRGIAIRFVWCGIHFFAFACVAAGVALRMASADDLSSRAEANATLAAKISRALARYDTKAAADALDAARAAGNTDEDLLEQFGVLIANLDRYRPHLPNWVVAADEEDGGTAEEQSATDDDPSLPATAESADNDDSRSTRGSSAGRRRRGSVTGLSAHSAGSERSAATPGGKKQPAALLRKSIVCVTAVDFRFPEAVVAPGRLDAVVDHVHELARRTQGAVHSFVGDRVTVSWNAASNVANPQAKAARFLVQIATAASDGRFGAGVRATGAAVSGPAVAHVAGAGSQRGLYIHAPDGNLWRELEALRAEAARQGAMLASERVRREADHAAVMRGQAAVMFEDVSSCSTRGPRTSSFAAVTVVHPTEVAALISPKTVDPSCAADPRVPAEQDAPAAPVTAPGDAAVDSAPVVRRAAGYALVGLRGDEGSEEWIYVLQKREARDADAARVKALQQWVAGDCTAAAMVAVLNDPPAGQRA